MIRAFFIALLMTATVLGFWMGREKKVPLDALAPEKQLPITTYKPFAFVVYAHNEAPWCERVLQSIFEQNYDSFRVILIDDASTDETPEKVGAFVVGMAQEHKVILIRNEAKQGRLASLYRALHTLGDEEIAIPLDAHHWLLGDEVLSRLNAAYQNPDVWLTFAPALSYPSYAPYTPILSSFYAAIFKQIRLADLCQNGQVVEGDGWQDLLNELARERRCLLSEPYCFYNTSLPARSANLQEEKRVHYSPLTRFPYAVQRGLGVDLVLFSYNRPLQLYACLESIHKFCSGLSRVAVLYRVSDAHYAASYETVKRDFPTVLFQCQGEHPKRNFKKDMLHLAFTDASPYICFGVDDLIVKDQIDFAECARRLEETGAYAFYLRLGKNIDFCYMLNQPQAIPKSLPLPQGIYAWDFHHGSADWNFPHNLDMTIYRKADVRKVFEKHKFETPNSMEQVMATLPVAPHALGLYFEESKVVNLPLNIVNPTGNPHMNFLSAEELLALFQQGLKMDIAPFFRIDNHSPHFEQVPDFIPRE